MSYFHYNKNYKFSLGCNSFIIGFISAQKLFLVGEIYLGEIFALVYILVNSRRLEISKPLRVILIYASLWVFSQIISDRINNSEITDAVKGIGAPLLFIGTLVALCSFWGREIQRMPSFLLGALVGQIPQFIFFPSTYFSGNPWKWGIGIFVIELFAVYFTFFAKTKSNFYLIAFVLIFAVVGFGNDSRSLATFPAIATVVYLTLKSARFGLIAEKFKGRFGITRLFAVIVVFFIILNIAVTAAFSSQWILSKLKQDSAEKFQVQSQGGYGVLFGGRSEVLVSLDAFIEKPLFGHGSWAKDNGRYQTILQTRLFQLGYSESDDLNVDDDLIPAHSYFMGSLVWAGAAGGIFWLVMVRWILYLTINNTPNLGFYFYNGVVALIWNIFFSPFGASARWGSAVFVASLYCFTSWHNKNQSK